MMTWSPPTRPPGLKHLGPRLRKARSRAALALPRPTPRSRTALSGLTPLLPRHTTTDKRRQKLVAEKQAKKTAERGSAEKKPETEAQRQSQLMAERSQRDHT